MSANACSEASLRLVAEVPIDASKRSSEGKARHEGELPWRKHGETVVCEPTGLEGTGHLAPESLWGRNNGRDSQLSDGLGLRFGHIT